MAIELFYKGYWELHGQSIFLGHLIRKVGLANLTLTEHNESMRSREKQRVICLNGNEQGSGGIVKTRSIAKESEVAEAHDRRGPE